MTADWPHAAQLLDMTCCLLALLLKSSITFTLPRCWWRNANQRRRCRAHGAAPRNTNEISTQQTTHVTVLMRRSSQPSSGHTVEVQCASGWPDSLKTRVESWGLRKVPRDCDSSLGSIPGATHRMSPISVEMISHVHVGTSAHHHLKCKKKKKNWIKPFDQN